MKSGAVVQYDLFGEVEAAEQVQTARSRAASTEASRFLVETPWPDLLSWWLHGELIEARLTRGEANSSYRRGPDGGPGWAWAIWRDGLRYEAAGTWQGFNSRPKWCIPWGELGALRRGHPGVTARLQGLADGRGLPTSACWRWWMDPYVLNSHGMHPSYLVGEQDPGRYGGCARPESAFADRLEAWQLVLDVVRGADLTVVDTSAKTRVA